LSARPHHIASAIVYRSEEAGICAGYPPEHVCPHKALPAVAGRCRACQDAWNVYRHRVRQDRKEAGLCTNCGEGDVRTRAGRVLCYACIEARQRAHARKAASDRTDALFALLGRLRGRRQEWAFWVLRQLGYTLDERHYLTAGPPEPPRGLVQVDRDELRDRLARYGAEHPLAQVLRDGIRGTTRQVAHARGAGTQGRAASVCPDGEPRDLGVPQRPGHGRSGGAVSRCVRCRRSRSPLDGSCGCTRYEDRLLADALEGALLELGRMAPTPPPQARCQAKPHAWGTCAPRRSGQRYCRGAGDASIATTPLHWAALNWQRQLWAHPCTHHQGTP
jgi:hypothetical protein